MNKLNVNIRVTILMTAPCYLYIHRESYH